jgi:site-specific recombinase XerD
MFTQFVKSTRALERYRNGPFARERQQYLTHLCQRGHSKGRLTGVNIQLLAIAQRLRITAHKRVTKAEVSRAAEIWIKERTQRSSRPQTAAMARTDFVSIASGWLRFLGCLDETRPTLPFASQLDQFLTHLRGERGLSEATVIQRKWALELFLSWLAARRRVIATVTPKDISEFFSASRARAWKRCTISGCVDSLRSFFRYAASRSWCAPDISETIDKPRLYCHEVLPQGPAWKDVQRLVESVSDENPTHIRNRAVILLLAVYGFRINEVSKLTLDDVDWEAQRLHVRRPKIRKVQEYPLATEVGTAIIRYLKDVRPRSTRSRELFLTLRAPYRPLSAASLAARIGTLVKRLDIKLRHYGAHALRHACATHLLAQGFSLKQIGDHLGHRSAQATRIYAKVDESSLRQVADQNLGDLIGCCATQCQGDVPEALLLPLQDVANLGLGDVL